jgi:hypothetical protein
VQADPDGLFGAKLCMCGGPGMGGMSLAKLLGRLLQNPVAFQGAKVSDVTKIVKGLGWTRSPASEGIGVRYFMPGRAGAVSVRIMKGQPGGPNPVKHGHYMVVSTVRGKPVHVPLYGNPAVR